MGKVAILDAQFGVKDNKPIFREIACFKDQNIESQIFFPPCQWHQLTPMDRAKNLILQNYTHGMAWNKAKGLPQHRVLDWLIDVLTDCEVIYTTSEKKRQIFIDTLTPKIFTLSNQKVVFIPCPHGIRHHQPEYCAAACCHSVAVNLKKYHDVA